MNAIHGSLAKFAAMRMLSRTPQHPVMSCIAKGKQYEMSRDAVQLQGFLLKKGLNSSSPDYMSIGLSVVVSIFGLLSILHILQDKV